MPWADLGIKSTLLGVVVEYFVNFFEDAVTKVKPFSVAKGRHPEIWPSTPKDLIPYGAQTAQLINYFSLTDLSKGPETMVESLVTWSYFMQSARVFSLVRLFMHICGPVIVPAIVASRCAPKYMIEHGLEICSDISSKALDANGEVDDIAAGTFVAELAYTLSVTNSLLTIPPVLNRDLHSGIANDAFKFATQAILTAESSAIPQAYDSDIKASIKLLAIYATVLCTTIPEQMTVPKARIHPVILAEMDRITAPSPPAELACGMMRHARTIQFCFAPGCPESAQTSGRVYMRCSGCRVVAYCSKECQAHAWTDKHLPHRNICKKMKQVYDIGGNYLHREEDQDKFVREMRKAKISDLMLKEIGFWMCEAYTKLQRKGPFLSADVREYMSQKKGKVFTDGMEDHMIRVKSSFLSKPKKRRTRS